MSEIQIHLVNVDSKKPLPQSSIQRMCHAQKEDNSWILYIQHDFGGLHCFSIVAKAVNEIMDGCLKETAELNDMLLCDSPSQIPLVLDSHNVPPDYGEENELLGQLVPSVCHYLMIQNPLCYFEEGDRVAYGEDKGAQKDWKQGEETEGSTKYTLAKILARANPVDNAAGEYDFKAEYKIDFGSKTEFRTVTVLDIYSYNQDEMGNPVSDDDAESKVNVPAEKCNIRRALILAKKLDYLPLRRKVLRRLFLHWFRCKDPHIAAEMTTFIETEVISLEILRVEETHSLTRYWRRRGRHERTLFTNYDHWLRSESSGGYSSRGCYSSRVYSFQSATEYVEPDTDEAERWMKQSKADLKAAEMLRDKSYSLVCFLSQQCVEKVLKGTLYAKCGIARQALRTHDVYRLASSVRRLEGVPDEAVGRSYAVSNYYLPTRYPDNQPRYRVPTEEYSEEQAKEALEVAETVYTALETFVYEIDE
jgi:HEPN domain-containing protein